MSRFRSRFLVTASLAMFSLSGCQLISQQPTLPSSTIDPAQALQQNQFSLQGKIGVKTPDQSGSAFYTWIQNGPQFNIQLNGALGVGKTIIEGQAGQVTLDNAKTGLITAATPEELLQQATGWVAPITALVDWVQARPATAQAEIQKDDADRIAHLKEAGWSVDFSYVDKATLPNKLILTQQLENEQENRITLLIQNR